MAKSSSETRRALAVLSVLPLAALPRKLLDVKRVERLAREHQAEQRAQTVTGDRREGKVTLLCGDMQERGAEIPDASVDLLFTDPPYHQEHLPLWSALSRLAARVLKPAGLLIAYTGQAFLPEVLAGLGERLRYWWCGTIVLPGQHRCVFPQRMANGSKLLLFYVRQDGEAPRYASCVDTYRGEGPQKAAHAWQQAVSEARYYIEQVTQPGEVVLDPFLGSGTTGLAAVQLGRQFIGIEADPVAFAGAHARLTGKLDEPFERADGGRVAAPPPPTLPLPLPTTRGRGVQDRPGRTRRRDDRLAEDRPEPGNGFAAAGHRPSLE